MGLRASQLRNRQQVQDSSSAAVASGGDLLQDSVKAIESNGASSTIQSNNNNNNNNIADDVTLIKEALHAAAIVAAQVDGDTQQSDALQQANGESNHTSASRQSSKGSTLQRQASHIQSLAQRIRRSSSVRRFIPSFVTAKRKASAESATPQTIEQPATENKEEASQQIDQPAPVVSEQLTQAPEIVAETAKPAEVSQVEAKEVQPQSNEQQVEQPSAITEVPAAAPISETPVAEQPNQSQADQPAAVDEQPAKVELATATAQESTHVEESPQAEVSTPVEDAVKPQEVEPEQPKQSVEEPTNDSTPIDDVKPVGDEQEQPATEPAQQTPESELPVKSDDTKRAEPSQSDIVDSAPEKTQEVAPTEQAKVVETPASEEEPVICQEEALPVAEEPKSVEQAAAEPEAKSDEPSKVDEPVQAEQPQEVVAEPTPAELSPSEPVVEKQEEHQKLAEQQHQDQSATPDNVEASADQAAAAPSTEQTHSNGVDEQSKLKEEVVEQPSKGDAVAADAPAEAPKEPAKEPEQQIVDEQQQAAPVA